MLRRIFLAAATALALTALALASGTVSAEADALDPVARLAGLAAAAAPAVATPATVETADKPIMVNSPGPITVPVPKLAVRTIEPGAGRAAVEKADPIARLAGRWSGQGNLTPPSGASEVFRCVVTYVPTGDGANLRQNLRCKGGGYKLEAATHLEISGARVRGHWEDKINALGGAVSGTVTKGGFDVFLSGRFFEAQMTVVAASECEQAVTLTPVKSSYIKELSASLRKC